MNSDCSQNRLFTIPIFLVKLYSPITTLGGLKILPTILIYTNQGTRYKSMLKNNTIMRQ